MTPIPPPMKECVGPPRMETAMTAKKDAQEPGRKRGKAASPLTIAVRRKQERAVHLRAMGWTFQLIADDVGYSNNSAACKAVKALLARADVESADEMRAVQNEQLRMQVLALMPLVASGDPEQIVKAAPALTRVLERVSKLNGLDAPVRSEVSGDGTVLQVVFDAGLAPKPPDVV